ncbi:MAG: helix-turn-helix transcriptional regulator [Chlorobium sp.]
MSLLLVGVFGKDAELVLGVPRGVVGTGCTSLRFWLLFSIFGYKKVVIEFKGLYMTCSVEKAPMPLPVKRAVMKFGRDLSQARRRRRFSQQSMAERIGISVSSLRRLEKGDPTLSWGTIARAMYVLGEIEKLNQLLDTANDDIGLVLMDEQLPRRIRSRKPSPESGAL